MQCITVHSVIIRLHGWSVEIPVHVFIQHKFARLPLTITSFKGLSPVRIQEGNQIRSIAQTQQIHSGTPFVPNKRRSVQYAIYIVLLERSVEYFFIMVLSTMWWITFLQFVCYLVFVGLCCLVLPDVGLFVCFIHRLHFLCVSYLMHIYTSFFMLKGMGILGAFDQFVFINFYHFC